MSIFRSELMVHKKIRMPKSVAHGVLNVLGQLENSIEFIDLNKENLETKRNYTEMVSRCDEVEKQFQKFEKICVDHGVSLIQYETYNKFVKDLNEDIAYRHGRTGSLYFDLVENEVFEDEKKLEELIDSYEKIKESFTMLQEKKAVYERSVQLFKTSQLVRTYSFADEHQRMLEEGFVSDLNYIAGVAKADDELRMKRMIFRVSKGRAIPYFFDLPEGYNNHQNTNTKTKQKDTRKIFSIFFQSGIENILLNKMLKVCDMFSVNRYIIPKREEIDNELRKIKTNLDQNIKFLKEAKASIMEFVINRAEGSLFSPGKYDLYRKFFKKEKLIYQNLNKCILTENLVNGEVWIPELKFDYVKKMIEKFSEDDPNMLAVTFEDDTTDKSDNLNKYIPPTYFQTNDLIYPFQEIVNTYGVPRYREVNPALFSIVTFPFLFGVMFGDIGHGLLLFLFALYLCLQKDNLINNKSIFVPALKARYILLFMGFFAFYSGWMYNDFISIPLDIFGSCYENSSPSVAHKISKDCTYPFGMDPKWYVASNELAFFNSLKMKLSVILGVIQMVFGIILRGMNNIYFNSWVDFIFEFVPQFIFMTSFFGYMIFMIFIKWSIDWSNDTSRAPNIITLLMNIFLKGGSVENKPLFISSGFQENIHFIVLMVCLVCIPFILIPKPLIVHYKSKKQEDVSHKGHYENVDLKAENKHEEKHEHHSLADLFVHQSIETIEFVLGSISNTASYLRLWALSLAHAQLAKVFFDKALLGFVQDANLFMVILGFFIFANVTFAVLMCMDLMECFLHTLRLHWVEFQNKFFKADGIKFQPFSFIDLIEDRS